MVMKKGFELQFHWIFVMIAGALILAFFFTVAQKQRTLSQEKLALTLSTDIENIFTGAIVSKGTAQKLPVPPQGLAFECSEGCDCSFRVGRAARSFGDKVMFAPGLVEGQDLTVWSLEWKQPYRVTNFLLVTNPDTKYYFVYDESNVQSKVLFEQLAERLPPLIEYESVTSGRLSDVVYEGHERTVFVLLNLVPGVVDRSFRRADVRLVEVQSVAQPRLSFYYNDGVDMKLEATWPIIDVTSIYAAIFADTATMYECGLKSAFKKMAYIADIYAKRGSELEAAAIDAEMVWCSYGAAVSRLQEQGGLAKELANRLDVTTIARLNPVMHELDRLNRDLVQQSCPELF